jgi:nitrate/nitrite transporter NarK
MARVSGLEKQDAPWHLRWFYGVMRKMFAKDLTPAKIQIRLPGLVWGGIAIEAVSLLSVICVAMAFLPVFWAIPTEILSDSNAAVAVGTINALASLAGFTGPYAFGYVRAETGSFITAFEVLMFCALVAGTLMLLTPAAQSRRPKSVTAS